MCVRVDEMQENTNRIRIAEKEREQHTIAASSTAISAAVKAPRELFYFQSVSFVQKISFVTSLFNNECIHISFSSLLLCVEQLENRDSIVRFVFMHNIGTHNRAQKIIIKKSINNFLLKKKKISSTHSHSIVKIK